jgi:hypothetical protein
MLIGGQYITTPKLIGQWLIERWVKEQSRLSHTTRS